MPNNPHDKFIKDVISSRSHAVELLQEILPGELACRLDWQSLQAESDSFVDAELRELFSDALFTVSTEATKGSRQTIQLYLLFEHKSRPDKRIHFQLLNYLARIYSRQEQPQIVIPIVFYHGQQKWNIPASFIDLFGLAEEERAIFGPYIPNFTHALYDLSQKELQAIQASVGLRSILHAMKHIWVIEEQSALEDWISLSRQLFLDREQEKTVERILFYLYVCTDIEAERIGKAIATVAPGHEDIAMSTAEKLRAEGMQKGKLEGIQEGKLESAKGMLDAGSELDFVLRVTGLTKDELRQAGLIK